MDVPASLRAWFVVHAIVDFACALPLLFFPEEVLPHLAWTSVDPVSTRLVAAALAAIGFVSWRCRNADVATFRTLLSLKAVWSATAVLGLVLAIARGAPPAAFALLSIFLGFCGVWLHYAIRFRQHAAAAASRDDDDDDAHADAPPAPANDDR